MISPDEALRLIASRCDELKNTTAPIDRALGFVLAEDVRSSIALPTFDNSAMDGFALRAADTLGASTQQPVRLRIAGTVYAGDPPPASLDSASAYRIMTGAPLPAGADTVVPQESARLDGSDVVVDSPLASGHHVRRRGEEIERGATILGKGHVINPGSVACLAAIGRTQVRVVRKPTVAVVTTGDETVAPGMSLRAGQIYDSNSAMMLAVLADMGIRAHCRRVKDDPRMLANAVKAALKSHDVLVFVGGVSVGDKDFLRPVLERQGVRELFWRVSQKPGKPLYFGVHGRRLVFGLPGNPASAFTCFYLYVFPALRRLSGHARPGLPRGARACDAAVEPDAGKWRFLRATSDDVEVTPLSGQASHMLKALAEGDCFIVVPPGTETVAPGERFETIMLPYGRGGSD